MTVTGIRIDQITSLSDYDNGSAHENVLRWVSFLASALHIPDNGIQACRTSLEAILLATYGEPRSYTTKEPESGEEDECQTSNLSPDELTKALITALVSDRLTTRPKMTSDDIKAILKLTSTQCEPDFTAKVKAAFEAGTKKRRLAVTKEYHIGTVPEQEHTLDFVFILFECSVPVVMRMREDQNSYQFVGECYINGFMDGEAVAMTVKGNMKEEELRLR